MKEKIRKLLALAADPSAAPNEAETAARQAAALMAKHDIDLADLEEAELKAQWDLIEGTAPGCRPGKRNAKEVPAWIGIIAWGVKCYTRTRCVAGRDVVYFRGPREDVELAQWLHTLIVENCYKESKGQSSPNAWRNGYAAAIQKRLKEMGQERADTAGSVALVKVDTARQQVMDERWGPEGGSKKSQTQRSMAGYAAGQQAGYAAGQQATIPQGRPVSQSFLRLN